MDKTFKKLLKFPKIKRSGLQLESHKFGRELYKKYKKYEDTGEGCGDLFIRWMDECCYALIIKSHIHIFKRTWHMLDKKGYTRNNTLDYGDMDVSTWVEYPRQKNLKVIISIRHCSCADDNTHIFLFKEYESIQKIKNFSCMTVWPKEKKYKSMKDTVEYPSVNTYRKKDFDFYKYGDGRDSGFCFKYESWPSEKAEDVKRSATSHALWVLRTNYQELMENK